MAEHEPASAPLIHLRPDRYHVIGPDDFGAPGLVARESVGPSAAVVAVGPIVTVHDSTFEPRSGIGHHKHGGMERLFYILEGEIEHDDEQNDIQGTMRTGDLGILTEGERGMVHSERNDRDGPARAYILVYPAEPLPPAASFDLIRDDEAPRHAPQEGVESKQVVGRGSTRLHGQIHELADSTLIVGASLPIEVGAGEGGLVFCCDGRIQVVPEPGAPVTGVGPSDTVVIPPAPTGRRLTVSAQAPSRVLHTVTGPGFGLRLAA